MADDLMGEGRAEAPAGPWHFHPDLTAERLALVARLLADGRDAAVERHDEAAGDNGWTLGCRAFQFGRYRILAAADRGEQPWLRVLDRSQQLTFQVGQVPVRFYHGEADEPTDGTLRQGFTELRQLELSFAEEAGLRDHAYRLAVETDPTGLVAAIRFVVFRGDRPVFAWDVPLPTARVGGVARPAPGAVPLAPPAVAPRRRDRAAGDA